MQQLPLDFESVIEDDIEEPAAPEPEVQADPPVQEDRFWQDDGWSARIVKSEDGAGWAAAMTREGESEPALVHPWTTGRDKKTPRPLDAASFATLVKTASDALRRHERQLQDSLRTKVDISIDGASYAVTLDIVPDDDTPYAVLTALDGTGEEIARKRVPADYRLTRTTARSWLMSSVVVDESY